MKKITILISLFAVFLAGCAGSRKFTEIDSGYRVDDDSVHLSAEEISFVGMGATSAGAATLPAAMALPAFGVATFAAAGIAGWGLPVAVCNSTKKCFGHEPYGDILMSGNVLRGQLPYIFSAGEENPELKGLHSWGVIGISQYRVFKNPKNASHVLFPKNTNGWGSKWYDNALYEKSLGLQSGDLVDVYYPHNPNLEREAIAKKLIYSGTIVRIVCKYDDDDCFDKYARNDDNFILGRWKTLEEYKAEYTTTGGFPNTETPTTATSE